MKKNWINTFVMSIVIAALMLGIYFIFVGNSAQQKSVSMIVPQMTQQEAAAQLAAYMAKRMEHQTAIIRYMESENPDVWHRVAYGWNWDAGIEPLRWIIRQPTCDRATALLIYWTGGPGFDAQYSTREEVPPVVLDVYDLEQEIEGRYLSGFYSRKEIAFDPRTHAGIDWTSEYKDVKKVRSIPQEMSDAVIGRELRDYCAMVSHGSTCERRSIN